MIELGSATNIVDLKRTVIYVRVFGEGADVWRPVEAVIDRHSTPPTFKIVKAATQDPTEKFEFPIGSVVHCELQHLSNGVYPVAVRLAPQGFFHKASVQVLIGVLVIAAIVLFAWATLRGGE